MGTHFRRLLQARLLLAERLVAIVVILLVYYVLGGVWGLVWPGYSWKWGLLLGAPGALGGSDWIPAMCAIFDGKSVGTTMGFSTADGLVMGTRTGSIDPGVLVALIAGPDAVPVEIPAGRLAAPGLIDWSQARLRTEDGRDVPFSIREGRPHWKARLAAPITAPRAEDLIVFSFAAPQRAWSRIDVVPGQGTRQPALAFRDDLLAVPPALAQEQIAQSRHVARGQARPRVPCGPPRTLLPPDPRDPDPVEQVLPRELGSA